MHDCVVADNPKAPVPGLSRQKELVLQRDGVKMHKHELRGAYNTKATNIVGANDLATKIVSTCTKCNAMGS